MPAVVKAILRGHLMRALIGFMALGGLLFAIVPETALIEALNLISLSFAGAVMVAYAPIVWRALGEEMPTRGQVLSVGIFLTQAASFIARIVSLGFRSLGWRDVVNTDLVSLFVYLTIIGALCHLNAPEVVDGAVPTRQWVRIGMIFGLGIFLVALFIAAPIWLPKPG